jgi:cytochrome P450
VAGATRKPIPLPTDSACPFAPPSAYRELRTEAPVAPLALPDGGTGWLVSTYTDARAILADHQRFSSRLGLAESSIRKLPKEPRPGSFIAIDPPDHTRFRKLLRGYFTSRRIQELEPRIDRIVTERLDAMAAADNSADLVADFALPIPSQVICEVLGVDYADRAVFQHRAASLLKLGTSQGEQADLLAGLDDFMLQLVRTKRRTPKDDLLSKLAMNPEERLSDEEIANVGLLLLVAGHETTANNLALAVFLLLQRTEELSALRADPNMMDMAVEELLRYLTVVRTGIPRVALEDVTFRGNTNRKGQTVVVSVASANRDADHFVDPDRLDWQRAYVPHLAFGHGVHRCIGEQLARLELSKAITGLIVRFPSLRLAVSPEQIPLRSGEVVYGVHTLPVVWSGPRVSMAPVASARDPRPDPRP